MSVVPETTISGVHLTKQSPASDRRGSLTVAHVGELHGYGLQQVNVVRSCAGSLRGMHVHTKYIEHYIPIAGRMFFLFKDARRWQPCFGQEMSFWVDESDQISVTVPPGVAHAVYFAETGTLVYGLTAPWTGQDEYGCRWDDPSIATPWPTRSPVVSDRDFAAGTFEKMADLLVRDHA